MTFASGADQSARDTFARAALWSGEDLVWSGWPRQGLIVHRNHALLLVVNAAFAAGLWWLFSVLEANDQGSARFSASAPVAVIVLLAWIPLTYVRDVYRRRQQVYVLTSERLLVFRGAEIEAAYDLDELSDVSLDANEGAVYLRAIPSMLTVLRRYSNRDAARLPANKRLPRALELEVDEARGIYDLIVNQRDELEEILAEE